MVVRFQAGSCLDPSVLRSGWSGLETWGVWSDGPEAQVMTMLEEAAQVFAGHKKAQASPVDNDMDQLKAELAALQAKVDKLSR